MRRALLWLGAVAGLALLGLLAASAYASFSVLGLASPGASTPPAPLDPILARAERAPPPPAPPPPAPAPVPVAAPARAEAPRAALRPPPDLAAWEATPRIQRGASMGRAGVDLEKGVGKLHAEFAPCFTAQGQAGYAGQPVVGVENPDADDPGSPVVTLEVAFSAGVLRVVDAPVEVRSGASDATLACLQARLRNLEVKTDSAPKAPRFRMRYNIFP